MAPAVLLDLLKLPTSPLNEQYIIEYVRQWSAGRPGLDFSRDSFGNIVLRLQRGKAERPPLVLCAHMDHPGFEARRMVRPGRVEAVWRGGVAPEYFAGSRVRFFVDGRWVRGTVREARVGEVRGRKRVKAAMIEVAGVVPVGAIGMWDLPGPVVRNGRIYARGCDDIAGVAAILDALDVLRRGRASVNTIALLTRAEEMGFAGALGACKAGTIPRDAHVVAVETSSEIPGVSMGNGPILRVGDVATIFSPGLTGFCGLVAKDLTKKDGSFRFQRKLMDGGTCESTVYYARGYDATGLCIALGNYHNMDTRRRRIAAEYIDLSDYAGLVKWFVALATTRRPYDSHHRVTSGMLAELERQLLPQLLRHEA